MYKIVRWRVGDLCSLCSWLENCHSIAQAQRHLSLLPGITPSRYQRLQELGLTTLSSLAHTPIENLVIYPEFPGDTAWQVIYQAKSSLENQPLPRPFIPEYSPHLNDNQLNFKFMDTPIEIYFDIEAEPELNLDYLHGILVVDKENNTEKFYSFLAESPAEELHAWQQLLELRLEFLGEVNWLTGTEFFQTEFGGLSGITYDRQKQAYYVISDDRGERAPARFYTLKIDLSQNRLTSENVSVISQTTLLTETGETFPP